MVLDVSHVDQLAKELEGQHPADMLAVALREFGTDLAISFSGAEDVVLVDMASRTGLPYRVFTLDTGRLHGQTYRFLETVRERYEVGIETFAPEAEAVQRLVSTKGYFSFYVDGHTECCGIRTQRNSTPPAHSTRSSGPVWITTTSLPRASAPAIASTWR